MNIKKFNELNESDSNDGFNKLPENVQKCTTRFLQEVQDYIYNTGNQLFKGNELTNISNNQFTLKVNLLTEQGFTDIIRNEFNTVEYGDGLSVSVHKKLDSRSTMFVFNDGNNEYTIPLITTLSGGETYDEKNIVEYKVWLNTYVANKI